MKVRFTGRKQRRDRCPRSRQLDRPRPIGPVLSQQQEAAQREHVRQHVAEVARRQDVERVAEQEISHRFRIDVRRHRDAGHAVAVQSASHFVVMPSWEMP